MCWFAWGKSLEEVLQDYSLTHCSSQAQQAVFSSSCLTDAQDDIPDEKIDSYALIDALKHFLDPT